APSVSAQRALWCALVSAQVLAQVSAQGAVGLRTLPLPISIHLSVHLSRPSRAPADRLLRSGAHVLSAQRGQIFQGRYSMVRLSMRYSSSSGSPVSRSLLAGSSGSGWAISYHSGGSVSRSIQERSGCQSDGHASSAASQACTRVLLRSGAAAR